MDMSRFGIFHPFFIYLGFVFCYNKVDMNDFGSGHAWIFSIGINSLMIPA